MTSSAPETTFRGVVAGLYTCAIAGEEMAIRQSLTLIAGQGVEGDRYLLGTGYYSRRPHEDRQITLIEAETLESIKRDQGIDLPPEETRRNVVTRGVPLAHLVGREFRIGNTRLYGGRLNVPCKYLEDLNDRPGVFNALVNRSGLNARILEGGDIHLGDAIEALA
ncbi:MOSC domain-containing protein [Subtercola frigoramans]|uniref:MOSC domain-containing protein YiiM n=1 Tax=Subtercola frigoramans TaxID=120298 RepID=A0ABS2L9X4_9MICO|nr:MOSC domain-containing protein [Subtercola frigoramans]MBM7473676.1 MOSC domain-containing protein YiiM [Subtercola frigoramans]